MNNKIYITPKGFWVRVIHGGINASDQFTAHTNDDEAYQKLDHRWTSLDEAQRLLDKIASENGWKEIQDER